MVNNESVWTLTNFSRNSDNKTNLMCCLGGKMCRNINSISNYLQKIVTEVDPSKTH